MSGWVLSWRVVLTRGWGWPGPATEAFDVDTVAHLRDVVMRARADPSIERCRFWRHREWRGPQPTRAPCGDEYVIAGMSHLDCQCGERHLVFRCHKCGTGETTPAFGDGCGPLPHDPEGHQHRS